MKLARASRVAILTLLLIGSAGLISLRAQQAPATPKEDQASTDSARMTPGRQLAHESREAAGEEKDEMEEFKHSASGATDLALDRTEPPGILLAQHSSEFRW